MAQPPYVLWLTELDNTDVPRVGGKNASLGEMIQRMRAERIPVPEGFATTVGAYWAFVDANQIRDPLAAQLERLRSGKAELADTGRVIRDLFYHGAFPSEVAEAIRQAYRRLGEQLKRDSPEVAVRSSATAEDLPEASFAGQQETFLNIRGEEPLLDACRRCFASLFTDRAIAYRERNRVEHTRVGLSVGVQRMVRSDLASAGVMFSIDTETGFPGTVLINANWGLGETVVQGLVDPDEYIVFKPLLDEPTLIPLLNRKLGAKARKVIYSEEGEKPVRLIDCTQTERHRFVLNDQEILRLARWAVAIEHHYGKPMDMEWAKDGITSELFVVQARPETVQSRREGALKTYTLKEKGRRLVQGLAIGDAIAIGPVRRLDSPRESERFVDGAVLVTGMTDPDWVPLMRRAAAIVTDHGGRTSHAAIVSRELGLPAIVGAANATQVLADDQEITVSCAEGDLGFVYEGHADYDVKDVDTQGLPPTRTQVMLNLANPAAASRWWRLPADGIGLARMEFVIGNIIKAHPMALIHWNRLEDEQAKRDIETLTAGWEDKSAYFIDNLASGIARIAAVVHPRPAIVRLSDFKTNEYAQLIGGRPFEPREENPMLGWRGASRYYSPGYREGFSLECQAVKKARERIGLSNVIVMIPFCRTPEEADQVLEAMAENGLRRGEAGLQVYVMCEVPSNVILAEEFAKRFDGFSIGSNDLTQLVLGVDRDSALLAPLFDERHPAVRRAIADVIQRAHRAGSKVGLCGQAPSDHPDFAAFLVSSGIDSISVDPGSFIAVKNKVAETERSRR